MGTRGRIITLAVGAVVVGVALAVAVNVATSPWTASWARDGVWLATGVVAGIGLGLAAWQRVWHRSDARHSASNGLALARETLVEGYALTPAPAEPPTVLGRPASDFDVDEWFTHRARVLLLGAPGAGKTSLLTWLTRRLAERARQDPDAPVPVLLSLASWGIGGRTLETWVAEELRRRLGVQPETSLKLLRPGKSFLLLDGLDEVPRPDRAGCVEEINGFLDRNPDTRLAVASRVAEYEELSTPLRLDTTIRFDAVDRDLPDVPDDASELDGGLPSARSRGTGRRGSPRPAMLGERRDLIGDDEPDSQTDEPKPQTGEWPPLLPSSPSGESPPPASPPSPVPANVPAASDTRLLVLEQRILSVLDGQVSQDEYQIASAARITPGETAQTLRRLQERGLVAPSPPRQTGPRIIQRYLKR